MRDREPGKWERRLLFLGVVWGLVIALVALLAAVATILPEAAADLLNTRVEPTQQTIYLLILALAAPFAATVRELDILGIRGKRGGSDVGEQLAAFAEGLPAAAALARGLGTHEPVQSEGAPDSAPVDPAATDDALARGNEQ